MRYSGVSLAVARDLHLPVKRKFLGWCYLAGRGVICVGRYFFVSPRRPQDLLSAVTRGRSAGDRGSSVARRGSYLAFLGLDDLFRQSSL